MTYRYALISLTWRTLTTWTSVSPRWTIPCQSPHINMHYPFLCTVHSWRAQVTTNPHYTHSQVHLGHVLCVCRVWFFVWALCDNNRVQSCCVVGQAYCRTMVLVVAAPDEDMGFTRHDTTVLSQLEVQYSARWMVESSQCRRQWYCVSVSNFWWWFWCFRITVTLFLLGFLLWGLHSICLSGKTLLRNSYVKLAAPTILHLPH